MLRVSRGCYLLGVLCCHIAIHLSHGSPSAMIPVHAPLHTVPVTQFIRAWVGWLLHVIYRAKRCNGENYKYQHSLTAAACMLGVVVLPQTSFPNCPHLTLVITSASLTLM